MLDMKVCGKMIKLMDKVPSFTVMETYIRANGNVIKLMAMESINGMMVAFITENG